MCFFKEPKKGREMLEENSEAFDTVGLKSCSLWIRGQELENQLDEDVLSKKSFWIRSRPYF